MIFYFVMFLLNITFAIIDPWRGLAIFNAFAAGFSLAIFLVKVAELEYRRNDG